MCGCVYRCVRQGEGGVNCLFYVSVPNCLLRGYVGVCACNWLLKSVSASVYVYGCACACFSVCV